MRPSLKQKQAGSAARTHGHVARGLSSSAGARVPAATFTSVVQHLPVLPGPGIFCPGALPARKHRPQFSDRRELPGLRDGDIRRTATAPRKGLSTVDRTVSPMSQEGTQTLVSADAVGDRPDEAAFLTENVVGFLWFLP